LSCSNELCEVLLNKLDLFNKRKIVRSSVGFPFKESTEYQDILNLGFKINVILFEYYKNLFERKNGKTILKIDSLTTSSPSNVLTEIEHLLGDITKKKYYIVRKNKRGYQHPESEEYRNVLGKGKTNLIGHFREWCLDGYKLTPISFHNLFELWKDESGDEKEILFQHIRNLGLLALPSIVSSIENDQVIEFIPIISYLVDEKISSTSSVKEVLEWWNKNKIDYPMPEMEYPEKRYEKL
jgi:hypothetical protein